MRHGKQIQKDEVDTKATRLLRRRGSQFRDLREKSLKGRKTRKEVWFRQ